MDFTESFLNILSIFQIKVSPQGDESCTASWLYFFILNILWTWGKEKKKSEKSQKRSRLQLAHPPFFVVVVVVVAVQSNHMLFIPGNLQGFHRKSNDLSEVITFSISEIPFVLFLVYVRRWMNQLFFPLSGTELIWRRKFKIFCFSSLVLFLFFFW